MTDRDTRRRLGLPLVARTSGTTLLIRSMAAARTALGILTPLRNARSGRIPPLCQCQYANRAEHANESWPPRPSLRGSLGSAKDTHTRAPRDAAR